MVRSWRSALTTAGATAATAVLTVTPAFAAAPAGSRVELKVLVVTDGGPATAAIAAELKSEGTPYQEVNLRDGGRPTVDAAFLADTVTSGGRLVDRAHYQAVVVPGPDSFGNAAESAALTAYEQKFDIPQVNAYVYPGVGMGLQTPTYAGSLDGVTATLTPAGLGVFSYLKGSVPFEDNSPAVTESYGFLAEPSPADVATGAIATPLLTATAPNGTAGNSLITEYRADNRRQLSLSFVYNAAQQQFRLLAPGIVNWMTGGVHLGLSRNFLSVQVDDVFMPDARWSTTGNCTPGEDCPDGTATTDIRMTSADVSAVSSWQTSRNFTFDMVFNGNGSAEAAADAFLGVDPLTAALVARRGSFRWTNHTWNHEYLGCVRDVTVIPWKCSTTTAGTTDWASRSLINSEISKNVTWATSFLRQLPIDRTELVTGEHSGLFYLPQQPQTNPNLAPALTSQGIKWLAADNSRMPEQIQVGSALTVPRYPMTAYYNVGKRAEMVDEYNWIYTSRADGGSGICEDNPATTTCITPLNTTTGYQDYIVPLETRLALNRTLGNDPRPYYVHQANLAEDRILLTMMDSILTRYRSLIADNAPFVNPRMSAAGLELQRQNAWRAAVAGGKVSGYLQDKTVHIDAPASLAAPITAITGTRRGTTTFGEAYAGNRSAWTIPAVNGTVDLVLP
ncbi:hypothetical protein ACWT_0235 [Actinoplanes sp. SE50]|uniref:hypothetical protein n=1 Tax=unclassified Actinoplanes TaxID=2626549 RepID=UPI00023EBC8F|nr:MULTISPECIES: hypothetical protein [unclassified Actinoplanes]AEV81247.1 hypothetical protein ACPL_350 [Actinoplanes sp. SE50/110]ATO79650.1 hypothetical protein ACWT_0235 [Actinoplanes sp. SE50]SLL97053.1 hypothetical protein ACSP50_0249 [Actinoplanes sp. SE50/110]